MSSVGQLVAVGGRGCQVVKAGGEVLREAGIREPTYLAFDNLSLPFDSPRA